MNPLLIAVLLCVTTAGHEINDVIRIDAYGESTNIAITWKGQPGMDRYIDTDEHALALNILHELMNH